MPQIQNYKTHYCDSVDLLGLSWDEKQEQKQKSLKQLLKTTGSNIHLMKNILKKNNIGKDILWLYCQNWSISSMQWIMWT